MKRVAIVAAHFPPSNLAAVHRARLWASHLPEFGWQPIIVTTHWRYYEEVLDWDLFELVPKELQIVRTRALPTRPVRLVGDIGIRGFMWHYRALRALVRTQGLDFVHITIPSNFSAPLGRLLHERHGVPYGIDYIDPWIHPWPGTEKAFTKARLSFELAKRLEPWSVRKAALITGVAPGYYEPVLERNPHLRHRVVTAAMPYGGSLRDHEYVQNHPRDTFFYTHGTSDFRVVYAGAMLPKAYPVLECLFVGLRRLVASAPALMQGFHLHFIGTGSNLTDAESYTIRPFIEKHGLAQWVTEHPKRIGYLDVLNHLAQSSAVLVLGSTEPHYSPSKIYQAALSKRPLLALLHEASTAAEVVRESGAGELLTFTEDALLEADAIAEALKRLMTSSWQAPSEPEAGLPECYSARESARLLAGALDESLVKAERVSALQENMASGP